MILPCASMRAVIVRKIADLLSAYEKSELLVQCVPVGRKVIVSKKGQNIEFYSRIGTKLSKHIKDASQDFLKLKNDIVVIGVLPEDRTKKFAVFDILECDDQLLIDVSAEERVTHLSTALQGEYQFLEVIDSIPFSDLYSAKTGLTVDNVLIKSRKSKLIVNHETRDEPTGEWFYYSKSNDVRDVIITNFYYGNNMKDGSKDVLFKCYQIKNRRQAYVGKIRIKNSAARKKCMNLIANGKRLVASVRIERDKRNLSRYKRLEFVKLKPDKPFTSVVCENDIYFEPIVIFDVRNRKRNVLIKRDREASDLKT
jgi:hypothetical protein